MRVKEVVTAYDYLTLFFDQGDAGIHIYNKYSISAGSSYDLTGKTIEEVAETDDDLKITFNDGTCLRMGKRESDHNGPESLIYFAGGNFYVDQNT